MTPPSRAPGPRSFDRGYAAIDRDYAAIHRSRLAVFGQRSDRPTSAELDKHRASIRRNDDDSIDVDFYRGRAAALRRQTMRQHATLRFVCAAVLALGLCIAVVMSAATPNSARSGSGVSAANGSPKSQSQIRN
jgi:hypothetical protein